MPLAASDLDMMHRPPGRLPRGDLVQARFSSLGVVDDALRRLRERRWIARARLSDLEMDREARVGPADNTQKITVAARTTAEKYAVGQRS